jgi:16S rRNA (guanine527-N7)-methyltransferase
MTPADVLQEGLGELSFDLPSTAGTQLTSYLALLAKWNRTYNLTAVRDPLEMVTHHVLDSLVVIPHLPMRHGDALADVGSGAGLPGIPLAIARPEWRVTLNDASQKKTAFLRQAAIELNLANVAIHEGRVEAWRPPARFAVVISRAFAEVARFVSLCRHLVRPGGLLAAMTGAAPERAPGEVIALRVPRLNEARHLVLCRVEGSA